MREWSHEEIFHDGRSFFSRLVPELGGARESIDFETYIFDLDTLGEKIIRALKAAAARGVRVRLVVDGAGSAHWTPAIQKSLLKSGVEFKIFHPLWRWKSFSKMNRRNHRKVCIVDRKIAYLGGINVSASHLDWRDTAARLEGPGVTALHDAFESAWRGRSRRLRRKKLNPLVKLNDSIKKRREYRREILRRVIHAKKRVWITSPYFVPEFSMIRALRFSAWSGKDVRIILPKKNDVFFMQWLNRAFYSSLLKAGVRIFEYLPRTLHAKTLIIDQWFILGSSNRNHRSLIHDLEVDVVLTHPESKESLEVQFLKDQKASREISRSHWRKRSWLNSVLERFLLIFRHWL